MVPPDTLLDTAWKLEKTLGFSRDTAKVLSQHFRNWTAWSNTFAVLRQLHDRKLLWGSDQGLHQGVKWTLPEHQPALLALTVGSLAFFAEHLPKGKPRERYSEVHVFSHLLISFP